jgi:hypothetical protein
MVTRIPGCNTFLRRATCAAAFLMLALCPGARGAEVQAQLDRDSVPAGNGALLTLRISGGRAGQPDIPPVENLIVQPRGQSQQMQVINGQTTVSVTYNYVVGSNTPGVYQIPAVEIMVDGKKFSTQPLKLKVLDAGAANPPAGTPPSPPGSPPAGGADADAAEHRFGQLTVELVLKDRNYLFVGEIAPVCIRAWIPADARAQLRSGIQPEGQAFTLHHVSDQPQQTQERKDGKRYLVVTWFGGISATKAGKYPASLSVNATVAVRDTSAATPRRRMGGPFDDPFFDRMLDDMNTPMIQKDVTLKSDDEQIEVRPLPSAGRPAEFTGAVGNFKFDTWELPATWTTGEPQQIFARLSGSGNFALMNAPQPGPAAAWKTYPGQSEFTPGDNASFAGSKSFQFSAVPRKGGPQQVALTFSFFDPATAAYKTLTSPPRNIEVAGEDLVDAQPNTTTTAKEPDKPQDDLAGQHPALTPPGTLVPLVSRPAFVRLLAAAAALCGLGQLLAWLRRRRGDPQRRARAAMECATRQARQTAAQCAAARDVAGFFAAARRAIQHRLGALWNQPAQAITLAEIQARLPAASPVARFFHEAYHQEYSRQTIGDIEPHWQALLDEALASLTEPAPRP